MLYRLHFFVLLFFQLFTVDSFAIFECGEQWRALWKGDTAHGGGAAVTKKEIIAKVVEATIGLMKTLKTPIDPELFGLVAGISRADLIGKDRLFRTYADFVEAVEKRVADKRKALEANPADPTAAREAEFFAKLDVRKQTERLRYVGELKRKRKSPAKGVISEGRLESWREGLSQIKSDVVGSILDFVAAKGRLPRNKSELKAITGYSHDKVVGLSTYAEGKALADFSVFKNPAEFKESLEKRRQDEITRLEKQSEEGALPSSGGLRLQRLKNITLAATRDGLFPKRERPEIVRARNWTEERPKARERAIQKFVRNIGETGSLPLDTREIGVAAGVGYAKLVGQAKYAPGQPSHDLSIFPNKESFKEAWTAAREEEIKRLRKKESEESLTPAEQKFLSNLLRVQPSSLPDGVRTRTPRFQQTQEALTRRVHESRRKSREAIVTFIEENDRVPDGKEIATITGIGEDRLLALGRWAKGKPRHKYSIYGSATDFKKDWAAEKERRLEYYGQKERTVGLTPEEKKRRDRLVNRQVLDTETGLNRR